MLLLTGCVGKEGRMGVVSVWDGKKDVEGTYRKDQCSEIVDAHDAILVGCTRVQRV